MEVGWLTISLLEAAIVLSDLSIVIPEEARIRQPCKADRGGVKAINPLPGGAEAEGFGVGGGYEEPTAALRATPSKWGFIASHEER